jgi:uncharacterized protein involved in outer membrane biogenesis
MMKKWVLIGGAVVVVIAVLLVLGISNLGPLIKNVVNTYGPKMTKTEVRLGDVSLSMLSGQAELKDFYLGNPKGFKSPEAMKVGSVYVDVDEGSLTGETIIIDKIEVLRPEITYEKQRSTDNFQTILNNLKRTTGEGGPSVKGSDQAVGGKKILIRDFLVRGGKVNLAVSIMVDKAVTASLPDIHLKDVGKDGAAPADVFGQVLAALYEKITSRSVTDHLNQELKALGLDVGSVGDSVKKEVQAVGEGAKKELKGVTDKVQGLLGK